MIKAVLQHNHFIKVASCVIAYMLWSFIAQYQHITIIKTAPLCFYQTNEQYFIKAPEHIKVSLSGTRKDLYHFASTVHIDASTYPEGTHLMQLSKENLFFPDNIKLVQLIPSHLSIEVIKT